MKFNMQENDRENCLAGDGRSQKVNCRKKERGGGNWLLGVE